MKKSGAKFFAPLFLCIGNDPLRKNAIARADVGIGPYGGVV